MTETPLAVITHGWVTVPSWFWYQDAGLELQMAGYSTITPRMYKDRHPNRQEWIGSLSNAIGDRTDVTVVAHSCSGRSALHYVEDHDNVRNLVVVAALIDDRVDDLEDMWKDFYSKPLNTEAIKRNCPNIVGLYSENDEVIPYDQADLFETRLGRVLRFPNEHHFLGDSLPVAITQLLV
jgi:predicted alpha/beta hydrolase family esterase